MAIKKAEVWLNAVQVNWSGNNSVFLPFQFLNQKSSGVNQ